jgi:hypothetical protein
MKLYRLPKPEGKRAICEMNLSAFFGATWQHADTAQRLTVFIENKD